MIKNIFSIILRDLRITYFSFENITLILGFYFSLMIVFPISFGTSSKLLFNFAPSIIWICLLLTSLSFVNRTFLDDLNNGWLDQIIISSFPLEVIVILKAISHWISISLPLIIITPIILLLLNIPPNLLLKIILILIVGSLALTLLGIMASALVLGSKNTNTLSLLIVLPLSIPTLIFGVLATYSVLNVEQSNSHLYLLCMSLTLTLIFSPITSSIAIKIASENY